MWRRVWDSNPRAQRANGFQDRLVMTTSITLRRVSLAKCSGIWREFRERTMKFLYDGKCRKPLILQGFWGNKRNSYARVFKTASLWPLRYPSEWNEERIEMWLGCRKASESTSQHSPQAKYPSVYELPFGRFHRIFNFFRNIFRNAIFDCFRSARKVSVYKAFRVFRDFIMRGRCPAPKPPALSTALHPETIKLWK